MSAPVGVYNTIMQAFFANATTDEQNEIWSNFLTYYGYTSPPDQTDETALAEFVSYTTNFYSTTQQHTPISPVEYTQRQIIFVLFEVILTMLNTMQESVANSAQQLAFLSKWQQEYTNQMVNTPIYQLDPGSPRVPDGESYATENGFYNTVGTYASITAAGIVDYMYTEQADLNLPFKVASGTTNMPGATVDSSANDPFNSDVNQSTVVVIQARWNGDDLELSYKLKAQLSIDIGGGSTITEIVTTSSVPVTTLTNPTEDEVKDAIFDIYSDGLSGNLSGQYTFGSDTYSLSLAIRGSAWSLLIPQRWVGGNGGTNDTNIKFRGNQNSLLQQYIENSRSRREIISNTANQVSSSISQQNEALNQQTSFLSSIIQEMQTMMAAIFR